MNKIKILFVGDVVGAPGRAMLQKHITYLKNNYAIDGVIVNGENSGNHGRGITPKIVQFFKEQGADIITSGNHIWYAKEIYPFLDKKQDLTRPANFPSEAPGTGVLTFTTSQNITVGVINIQGRVFMRELVSCPFKTVESILTYLKSKTSCIVVDMHAEASSEKIGLAHFLDGKVSAVLGTHTHVQTADERILPHGTAFMTDVGMVGALNGMLGMKKEPIIHNFLTQMPVKFAVDDTPPFVLCAAIITIDTHTGKAIAIDRIRIVDSDVIVEKVNES